MQTLHRHALRQIGLFQRQFEEFAFLGLARMILFSAHSRAVTIAEQDLFALAERGPLRTFG